MTDAQSLGVFVNLSGLLVFFLIVVFHLVVAAESKEERTD